MQVQVQVQAQAQVQVQMQVQVQVLVLVQAQVQVVAEHTHSCYSTVTLPACTAVQWCLLATVSAWHWQSDQRTVTAVLCWTRSCFTSPL